jgi:hypothetical protein
MKDNEVDKISLDEVTKTFDASGLVLNELASEITQLEIKFGSSSKLAKAKRTQLNTLRQLYDKTLKYINYLRSLNHAMYTEFTAMELARFQKETGLPISKIMGLAGHDPTEWQAVDELDAKINRIKEVLQIPEVLSPEFETFIEVLRKGSPTDTL